MKREEWTVKIVRLFGTPLAKFIAKLPFNVNPNVITLLSLIPAIIAGYCFFNNQLLFGALFFFISYILDCTDGTLARLTNQESVAGKQLDFYIDILGNVCMYFGLWYSQFYLHGLWFGGGLLIFAHYCVMVFGYMFVSDRTYKTRFPSISTYYGAADEGFITFAILPIFNIFIIGLPILIALQFISYIILACKQEDKPDVWHNILSTLKLKND